MSSRLLRDELQDVYRQGLGKTRSPCILVASGSQEALKSLLEVVEENTCILRVLPGFSEDSRPETASQGWIENIGGDLSFLPLRSSSLGLVVYAFAARHGSAAASILSEAKRPLKSGGVFMIAEWTPKSRLKPQDLGDTESFASYIGKSFARFFKPVDFRLYRDYFILIGLKGEEQ